MVFSSIPVYLDPHNWHQQQNHHHTLPSSESPQLPPLPPPQLPHGTGSGSGPGSIRPGSMADRARMAKMPQPETALKCPRCESANTKFCYFNNYSLSQPRHFCKTCRRYWTRGGALRNVPVGGGCRRNKKSKSGSTSRSKSPATSAEKQQITAGPNSIPNPTSVIPSGAELVGHFSQPQTHTSFMASIQNLARFGGGAGGGLGLNFSEIQGQTEHHHNIGFQIGSANNISSDQSGVILQGGEADQWRLQQFPFLATQDFNQSSTAGFYNPLIQGSNTTTTTEVEDCVIRTNMPSDTPRVSQFPPVKMEGRQGLNLSSRPSLGISENNHNFWGGNSSSTAWTDLSGLNSSSASHLL